VRYTAIYVTIQSSDNATKVVDDYEYLILGDSDWDPPFRTERIRQMLLKQNTNITLDTMAKIQTDMKTVVFEELKPFLCDLQLSHLR